MRTLLVVLVLAVAGSVASGHAKLERSTPADGAVLERAPDAITLRFNSEVERKFGKFALRLPDGTTRTLAGPSGSGLTNELAIAVGTLSPGEHELAWSVVSRDGHRIAGRVRFTIRSP